MTIVVVAEKPNVARDIARVLGARKMVQGVLEGNGYVVTWALGLTSTPNLALSVGTSMSAVRIDLSLTGMYLPVTIIV